MLFAFAGTDGDDTALRLEARLQAGGFGYCRRMEASGPAMFCLEKADEKIAAEIEAWPEVARVYLSSTPFALVTRDFRSSDTVVPIGDTSVGGGEAVVIAGPCGVEGRESLLEVAAAVKAAGAHALRGGAFKPRTSPYAFQGLGSEGLKFLADTKLKTGLPIVTEVMSPEDVDAVAEVADVLQVGTRNMQNFRLLEAVGRSPRPVLLKRGMMATIDEFLSAAEYIRLGGNEQIILCERGIRTFETRTRNTLDLAAVAILKRETHLPVLVDPSHGTGLSEIVPDLCRAALAVGADGLLVEVHEAPEQALSDGRQSLRLERFASLMDDLRHLSRALGRPLAPAVSSEMRAPAP
ncbi:MAG: 3-deoxy-7-phosphoheptulonate synthase [Planctomycetota bacterium]